MAWFSSEKFSKHKIVGYVLHYNSLNIDDENYITENFADTYFCRADCSRIGFIRQDIEDDFFAGELNERERAIFVTSLLYSMDKIASTCGHYDAFRQGATFDRHLELAIPIPKQNRKNECYNDNANELAKHIQADLVYIDLPCNSRQYCDAYHCFEKCA